MNEMGFAPPVLHVHARCTFDQVWADLEHEERLHTDNFAAFREWCEKNAAFEDGRGSDPGARPRIAFPMIYYGTRTCWWGHASAHLGALPSTRGYEEFGGLPCDPRGGVLLQTDNWRSWLVKSRAGHDKDSPAFGIARFMAAHHLNAFNERGAHWAVPGWPAYEQALREGSPKIIARLRRSSVVWEPPHAEPDAAGPDMEARRKAVIGALENQLKAAHAKAVAAADEKASKQ